VLEEQLTAARMWVLMVLIIITIITQMAFDLCSLRTLKTISLLLSRMDKRPQDDQEKPMQTPMLEFASI
jgi:hypothetical protein